MMKCLKDDGWIHAHTVVTTMPACTRVVPHALAIAGADGAYGSAAYALCSAGRWLAPKRKRKMLIKMP